MSGLNKYRIWCNTDSKWEYVWLENGASVPSTCPSDPVGHSIDVAKTSIIDTTVGQSVELATGAYTDWTGVNNEKVLRFAPQPSSPGLYMCDRDFLLKAGVTTDAFEDLRVTPSTMKRSPWNELSFIGVYKGNDTDGYTACSDQTDADTNSCLSVWEYQAKNYTSGVKMAMEIRGGTIAVPTLTVPNSGDEWKYQFYVVMAPALPLAYGGQVKFFDGYLKPYEGGQMQAVNQLAVLMDPAKWNSTYATATGTSEGDNTKIRLYLYYPAGIKLNFVLRFITYRALGTS